MGRISKLLKPFKKTDAPTIHTPIHTPSLPVNNKTVRKAASGGVHITEAAATSRGAGAGAFLVGAGKATVITVGGFAAISAAQEVRRAAAQAIKDMGTALHDVPKDIYEEMTHLQHQLEAGVSSVTGGGQIASILSIGGGVVALMGVGYLGIKTYQTIKS